MATPRRCTYVSVQNNQPNSVVTSADTWGQLKSEFADIGAKAHGMKAHIRETGVDITNDGQYLPSTDFTVYFLIEKNKSGGDVEDAVKEFIDEVVKPLFA